MERRLRKEEGMTIEVLAERGVPKRAIARTLGVAESSVRYWLSRAASGAVDGRSRQASAAAPWSEAIAVWMTEREPAEGGPPAPCVPTSSTTRAGARAAKCARSSTARVVQRKF